MSKGHITEIFRPTNFVHRKIPDLSEPEKSMNYEKKKQAPFRSDNKIMARVTTVAEGARILCPNHRGRIRHDSISSKWLREWSAQERDAFCDNYSRLISRLFKRKRWRWRNHAARFIMVRDSTAATCFRDKNSQHFFF